MDHVFDQFFTWLCWFAAGATAWIVLGYLAVRSIRRPGETAGRPAAEDSSPDTTDAGRTKSGPAGIIARPAGLVRRTVFAAVGAFVVLLAMNAVAGRFIGLAVQSGTGPNATASCQTCGNGDEPSGSHQDSNHASITMETGQPGTMETGQPGLSLVPIPDPQRSQEAPDHAVQSL